MDFRLQEPKVINGIDIEKDSISFISNECEKYPKYQNFKDSEKEIVKRLIHTTSLFEKVIDNVYFSEKFVEKSTDLLKSNAPIIVDTNMIKSGISDYYTSRYGNDVICYVSDKRVMEESKAKGITRTYLAVKKAIIENKNRPMILACGNAPTFIYSMIETIINEGISTDNMSVIAYPVGFINVAESKDYLIEFSKHYNIECSVMRGNFGSSTMIVATLHAIYKMF